MKHKYIRELFPDRPPFPYDEEDYNEFDERDTFNLDHTLIMWLYERLRFFQDKASQIVNFDFHKFDVDGEELTQRECIDRMVEDCKAIVAALDAYEEGLDAADAAKNDLFKVLSEVYWAMWW